MPFPPTPTIERIVSKLDTSGECWLWTGSTSQQGYAILTVAIPERKMVYVHRLMYEMAYGDIPEGHEVAHLCDTPRCVRPTHLLPMTHAENMADMATKGRHRLRDQWEGYPTSGRPRAKLDEEKVRAIRKRHSDGERRKALADEYGVAIATIDAIIQRRNWKHVA